SARHHCGQGQHACPRPLDGLRSWSTGCHHSRRDHVRGGPNRSRVGYLARRSAILFGARTLAAGSGGAFRVSALRQRAVSQPGVPGALWHEYVGSLFSPFARPTVSSDGLFGGTTLRALHPPSLTIDCAFLLRRTLPAKVDPTIHPPEGQS